MNDSSATNNYNSTNSTTTNNNEDLELEEGEIAEDSNDGCSVNNDDDDDNFNERPNGALANGSATAAGGVGGGGGGGEGATEPQKKRKKVVKVRKKIRVKKKVLRKKGANNNAISTTATTATITTITAAPAASTVAVIPAHTATATSNTTIATNTITNATIGNVTGASVGGPCIVGDPRVRSMGSCAPNGPGACSLWEQQILMLQELRNAQILRAAATDEDLRIPVGSMQQPFQQQLIHQQIPVAPTPMTTIMGPHPIMLGNTATPTPTNTAFALPTNHQTPSSPDEEDEKSSYDAISKMLNMLRHSANNSDENNDPNDNQNHNHHQNQNQIPGVHQPEESGNVPVAQEEQVQEKSSIEYALVPILVQGIDYTKYRLLSRYEPKFKHDPRLNLQQT